MATESKGRDYPYDYPCPIKVGGWVVGLDWLINRVLFLYILQSEHYEVYRGLGASRGLIGENEYGFPHELSELTLRVPEATMEAFALYGQYVYSYANDRANCKVPYREVKS